MAAVVQESSKAASITATMRRRGTAQKTTKPTTGVKVRLNRSGGITFSTRRSRRQSPSPTLYASHRAVVTGRAASSAGGPESR